MEVGLLREAQVQIAAIASEIIRVLSFIGNDFLIDIAIREEASFDRLDVRL